MTDLGGVVVAAVQSRNFLRAALGCGDQGETAPPFDLLQDFPSLPCSLQHTPMNAAFPNCHN